jgi:hypothetical protein
MRSLDVGLGMCSWSGHPDSQVIKTFSPTPKSQPLRKEAATIRILVKELDSLRLITSALEALHPIPHHETFSSTLPNSQALRVSFR